MPNPEPVHTDSMDQQGGSKDGSVDTKTKSRRPPNTAFRQQRLKAWQPILTPRTVLPLFFAIGIIFAPIGGLLLWASSQVQELVLDYSKCATDAPRGDDASVFAEMPANKVSMSFRASNNSHVNRPRWKSNTTEVLYAKPTNTSVCSLEFTIPQNIGPPVLLYYRLTNFYQNHRRYVKSYDQSQLKGRFVSNGSIASSACNPLELNATGYAYYPCGLIANSLFNDTFTSPVQLNVPAENVDNRTYEMSQRGIAWDSDRSLYGKTEYKWYEVAPPPNWQRRFPDGYTDDQPPPALEDDESFMVWMRTAGLPTFSKLALRNDDDVMVAGRYRIDIRDDFPVTAYGGTKSIVISTRTVMGGKNPFLGIAYIVVGGICIVLGALFTGMHFIKPRKLGDHTYLSWNNDQGTAGAATTTTGPNTAAAAGATATGRDVRPSAA